MDAEKQIEQLNLKVAQLEDENRQLQQLLQKMIKKYKKLKEKEANRDVKHSHDSHGVNDLHHSHETHKEPEKSKAVSKSTMPTEPELTESSSSSLMGDPSGTLLQNLEFDNLPFIQSMLPSITANYYFPTQGTYLIHEAVKAGAIKVLHYICAKGADLNLNSKKGESALTLGAEENKHDAMCIVLQHGREKINLEYQNEAGLTALQIAVKNGNKEIVGLLVAHGANVNATNFLGDSLIKLAQRSGHQEIVMLLVNAGASLR